MPNMPRKKKATSNSKIKKRKRTGESFVYKRVEKLPEVSSDKPKTSSVFSFKNILLAVILISLVLVWKFKGLFIAAVVNGQPISRMYLNRQILKRFGDQVLDNIISERLILSAVRQKSIFITTEEIDQKIKEVEKRLEGKTTIDEALKVQGLTKEDFKRQTEIQLSIDKMFEKDASISAEDIDGYIEKNKEFYKDATDQASLKEEVKNILRQQKITELFDSWFTEVRKNAKIQKFL